MKLVWLTAEMPYPPNTGGRIGMFKRIEYLSRRNEIFLYSITDRKNEAIYRYDLLRYCKDVNLYCREGRFLSSFLGLIKGPYVCESRWFPRMMWDIDSCFDRLNPDFVIVDFPQMMGNISNRILSSGKVILNQHNTEYVALRNITSLYKSWFKRFIGRVESYRLEKYERCLYEKKLIKLFSFVSLEDKAFFEQRYNLSNTLLVPVGTEIKRIPFTNKDNFVISYIGKMEYPANAEAVIWFAENVLKQLSNYIPSLKFYAVGKNPPPSVRDLSKRYSNIIVTGTVESTEEYYQMSDVIVIPLFHGGGVKVKLLEALGYGKFVITTSKGIEGTLFKNGKELIIADTANEFIESCIDAYENPQNYNQIRENGYKIIEEKYTWEAIINEFEAKLRLLI